MQVVAGPGRRLGRRDVDPRPAEALQVAELHQRVEGPEQRLELGLQQQSIPIAWNYSRIRLHFFFFFLSTLCIECCQKTRNIRNIDEARFR